MDDDGYAAPADSEALALAALEWIDATAVADGDGVWWSAAPSEAEPDLSLYFGVPGIVLALLEAQAHFAGTRGADPRWSELAARGTRWLTGALDAFDIAGRPGLYGGAAGIAVTLHEAAGLVDAGTAGAARAAAARGLAGIRAQFDGDRWGDPYELMFGNAGIALAALRMGDLAFAEAAVTPYLRTAEATPHGQTWEQVRGRPARWHHMSHGTLGIAYALAAVGAAAGRNDLIEAALAGVADVVARNDAGPDGFLVPNHDPHQEGRRAERYSYGWCHGPAGDAQLFRLLTQLSADAGDGGAEWRVLADRCWRTITTSGLPVRLRPGFWDNSGRCCGTAGVLALACDRLVENGDDPAFADVLVADIAERATIDTAGARWSNVEHRNTPPELEPRPGWAWGNAGLVRELLRHARITSGRDPAYAVQWPDQPPAGRITNR